MKVISQSQQGHIVGGSLAVTTVLLSSATVFASVSTAALTALTGGLVVVGAGIVTLLSVQHGQ
jgi:hypothetical protein